MSRLRSACLMMTLIKSYRFPENRRTGAQSRQTGKRARNLARTMMMKADRLSMSCRANSAHIRQTGPECGPGLHVKVIKTFKFFPLRSEPENRFLSCGAWCRQGDGGSCSIKPLSKFRSIPGQNSLRNPLCERERACEQTPSPLEGSHGFSSCPQAGLRHTLPPLQGHLAHKKHPPSIGPPYGPRHSPNVGS